MRSHHVTLTRPARFGTSLAAGLAMLFALPAVAVEYDGNWQFTMSCAANGAQTAFSERFTAPITQNAASRSRSGRTPQGAEDVSRFNARVEAGQMSVVVDRIRGAERWSLRFAGPATSESRFELPGGMFSGERQLRSCRLEAEAVTSAPGSLAATAPARAEAARQRLAAAFTALEASSAADMQAIRTELDLARFEGAAMRALLDQRGAAVVALETRLRQAEGATAQAQAALAQAVATATAEIGQRDQRLSAATGERAALQTRLTAAETAATHAQTSATAERTALQGRLTATEAAAVTERTALQGRLSAAEAASTQAQAAAAAERTALQARLAAAEATAAQLRTALETARRELTDARAAQPPR